MSVKVDLLGLSELRAALRALPSDMAAEANDIVVAHGTECKKEVEQGYPLGPSGNLRRGVTLSVDKSPYGTTATVKSNAKIAYIFEKGSVLRHTRTGANRGQMPVAQPEQRLIPKAIQIRARMRQALIALVKRAGFVVTEE